MYCVLDIEATNGTYGEEKIIEIAIYQYNGHEITDQFISLVNPETNIGKVVEKLTGITNKMVKSAPKFHELAKRIVEITQNCILVGHNVKFDFRMLRQEFHRLGYVDFNLELIDTLPLSQTLLPNVESYSLGKLCKSLGIVNQKRHRASGDALATLKLFALLKSKDNYKQILIDTQQKVKESLGLNPKIVVQIQNLPTQTGVFYLLDEKNKIIYLNHALNIRQVCRKLLLSKKRGLKSLQSTTQHIDFELTGSLAIARIQKKEELKTNLASLPLIGRKPRTIRRLYGIYYKENELDVSWSVKLFKENYQNLLFLFQSKSRAQQYLQHWLNGLNLTNPALEKQSALQLLKKIHHNQANYFVVDQGNGIHKYSFLCVENFQLMAYGFFDYYHQITKKSNRIQRMNLVKKSLDNQWILYDFLRKNPNSKIILN